MYYALSDERNVDTEHIWHALSGMVFVGAISGVRTRTSSGKFHGSYNKTINQTKYLLMIVYNS